VSHAAVKTALSLSLGKFNSRAKDIQRIAMVSDGLTSDATEMGDLKAPPTRDGTCGYRSGITGADGKLTADWRGLFERYSDRFRSVPIPGSTSAGSVTILYSENIAAGLRSFPASTHAALQQVTRSVFSIRRRGIDMTKTEDEGADS